MNRTSRVCRRRWLAGGILGCLLATWGCLAQPINPPSRDEINMDDVIKASGKRLGEGRNTTPTGPLRVKSYTVDEIRLAKRITITRDGKKRSLDTVYRLTISGEHFPVRALLTVIWINDRAFLEVHPSEDLRSLSLILWDRADLKPGATIAVGYGEEEKDQLTPLPEKLQFDKEGSGVRQRKHDH